MRQILSISLLILVAISGMACAATPTPLPELKAPTVALNRVEVASYFPYPAIPPTPTPAPNPLALNIPLVLAWVFDVNNPNPYAVTLTKLQFATDFEAAPNEYFGLNTPIVTDAMAIPGGATNQVRVTVVYDTAAAGRVLAVTGGARLQALKLNTNDVIYKWWNAPANPTAAGIGYGVRASQGTAEFNSEKGNKIVQFDGKFPK